MPIDLFKNKKKVTVTFIQSFGSSMKKVKWILGFAEITKTNFFPSALLCSYLSSRGHWPNGGFSLPPPLPHNGIQAGDVRRDSIGGCSSRMTRFSQPNFEFAPFLKAHKRRRVNREFSYTMSNYRIAPHTHTHTHTRTRSVFSFNP